MGSHMYVNVAELKRECRDRQNNEQTNMLPAPEIIDVIIHREELEMEIVGPQEDQVYFQPPDQLSGGESPPMDCNLSLIATEPRHTM